MNLSDSMTVPVPKRSKWGLVGVLLDGPIDQMAPKKPNQDLLRGLMEQGLQGLLTPQAASEKKSSKKKRKSSGNKKKRCKSPSSSSSSSASESEKEDDCEVMAQAIGMPEPQTCRAVPNREGGSVAQGGLGSLGKVFARCAFPW